ncbi:MAG: sulfatase [Bryobacteraceae bacterium]|nr:sulfatase [Bryobacteraceae bacterium]
MPALRGAQFWAAYGVVELFFLAVWPWIVAPERPHERFHVGFSILIVGLYAAVGAAVTALAAFGIRGALSVSAALRRADPSELYRAVAASTLAWAFGINMALAFQAPAMRAAALAMPVLLTTTLIVGYLVRPLAWVIAFARPWTLGIVLVGTTWLASHHAGRLITVAALALALTGAVAFRRRIEAWSPRLKEAAAAAAFVLLLGAGAAIDPSPPIGAFRSAPSEADGPNVLLLTLDTVRADHLSVYGYARDTSPNLNEFAADATLYRDAVSAGDMTLTGHASIFTGMYAARHGAFCSREVPAGWPLDDRFTTLAETLKENGYRTAAVVANNGYLGRRHNLHQGFDFYDSTGPALYLEGPPRYWLRGAVGALGFHLLPYSKLMRWTRDAAEINRRVFRLLDVASETPFFLFVNYMDAHRPYLSPPPFNAKFRGRNPRFGAAAYESLLTEIMSDKRSIAEEEREHLTSQYDGAIAYLDHELGGLFARLKQLGLYDRTLIVVTSDHGEAFGDKNLLEHGSSVYQDQVGVPLIIRYPGQDGARVVEGPASGVDILPTVLDALGIAPPDGIQGRSLQRESGAVPVLAESYAPGLVMGFHRRFRLPERAVFLGPWKLIESRKGRRELYNLAGDPREARDLYGTEAPLQEEMEQMLVELSAAGSRAGSDAPKLDPATLRRLRGLGYLK